MKPDYNFKIIPKTNGKYSINKNGYIIDNHRNGRPVGQHDLHNGNWSVKLMMDNGKRTTTTVNKIVKQLFQNDHTDTPRDVVEFALGQFQTFLIETEKMKAAISKHSAVIKLFVEELTKELK